MPVAYMRELCKLADTSLCGFFDSIDLPVAVELAVEVWRPRHVNCPAVEMSFFSMLMVRFGMNMEQRRCKHPQRCPDEDSHPTPRICSTP